jgi:hypothetical protein
MEMETESVLDQTKTCITLGGGATLDPAFQPLAPEQFRCVPCKIQKPPRSHKISLKALQSDLLVIILSLIPPEG